MGPVPKAKTSRQLWVEADDRFKAADKVYDQRQSHYLDLVEKTRKARKLALEAYVAREEAQHEEEEKRRKHMASAAVADVAPAPAPGPAAPSDDVAAKVEALKAKLVDGTYTNEDMLRELELIVPSKAMDVDAKHDADAGPEESQLPSDRPNRRARGEWGQGQKPFPSARGREG